MNFFMQKYFGTARFSARVAMMLLMIGGMGGLASFHATPVRAQTAVISEIEVKGTRRIDPETVTTYMTVAPGDPMDPNQLDQSLKALFATELFADVRIRQDGTRLVVSIAENPIINRIAFEGNQRIKDADLTNETQLQPRQVFTRTKVQQDVQRILKIYQRSGRFASKISPKVIQLEQNRVDLIFEIDEGPLSRIRKIVFIGNRKFSDSDLRDTIQSKEYVFWRLLRTSDTYDPDRLGLDRELLRRFYLENSHIDFKVISAVAELTPDREDFVLTFTLEEGERYRYGKIDLEIDLERIDREKLLSLVTLREGEWYNAVDVEKTVDGLTDEMGTLGYAFVEVRPAVKRHPDERVIDVTFVIGEGPRVYVERIDIEGNVRTLDKVIRREFELVEGDAFNVSKLRRSRRAIRNLGFFAATEIDNEEGSATDKTIIKTTVSEQPTGQISFGVGYSSIDGVVGDIGISERNLLGRGQQLTFQTQLSETGRHFDISFTEPYFLDRDLTAGLEVFRTTRVDRDDFSFDEYENGGGVHLGYDLATDLRQSLRYNLKKVEVRGVDRTASRFIRAQAGSRVYSTVGQTLTWDKRDSRIDPREGYVLSMSNDFTGLGGSATFLRTRLRSGYYQPLLDKYVLQLLLEGGYIVGLGEDVSIVDRFFIGGRNLRGFAASGIGPRDTSTDDALGGNLYYTGTVEISTPVLADIGMRASVFGDFGSLWQTDETGSEISDESSLRASIGVGISWNTPLGPIRIDFARAVLKEDIDETETIRFSFGTRF